MRGQILGVEADGGVILDADDVRVAFVMADWRSPAPPQIGQAVDFVPEAGGARHVYAIPNPTPAAPSSTRPTGAFVLGATGVGCLALGLVIPVLPTLAAFIFGMIGASRAQLERDDTALTLSRIAWIGALVLMGLGMLAMLVVFAFFGSLLGVLTPFIASAPIHV
ncbi:MAG: hypothetical protein AB7L65_01345 [Hyphomonadaceae bacterium]